jgi:hypothetical protein
LCTLLAKNWLGIGDWGVEIGDWRLLLFCIRNFHFLILHGLFTTLFIFLFAFGAVLVLERLVHRTLQTITLVLSGHREPSVLLYSITLLPGVALHELSHALMAMLLGVPVRGFSLIPKRQGKSIRLGCVDVLRTDVVRMSLIGAAPLVSGAVALIVIGFNVFDANGLVDAVATGNASAFVQQLLATLRAPDSLLWFYLVFAIANSMMPSPSDTQSWPPVVGFLALSAAIIGLIFGFDWLQPLKPSAQFVLNWLAAAFAITTFINLIVIAALSLVSHVLQALTGRRVEFRG